MIKPHRRARFFAHFAFSLALISVLTLPAHALEKEDITADSAVLIDADTGQILFDKNMHQRREPASVTKILTGLLVMERCNPDETVVVSDSAVQIPLYSSHIALTQQEELPVDSAMYAMMLPSANDAANALAEHVSGSQESFADLMNQRARELGAVESHFVNAHGLPDEGHYTTAYDMALITRAAIQTPGFLKYFGTARHTIAATNKQAAERPFTNQNFMLLPDMWVYNPEIIGGKVGYTQEARNTMASAARRGERTLVAVVLGCGTDQKFYDTQALFDYGFDSFRSADISLELADRSLPILEGEDQVGNATFSAGKDEVSVLLPRDARESDLQVDYRLPDRINSGDTPAASVVISLDGQVLLEVPVDASLDYDSFDSVPANLVGGSFSSGKAPGVLLWLIVPVLIAALLIWRTILVRRKRLISRQRRQRAMEARRNGRGEGRMA